MGGIPSSDVTLADLEGGSELPGDQSVAVNSDTLREVLATPLFGRLAGGPRFVFSHQTYAEFLAAEYLVLRGATIPQVMGLIAHLSDPDNRIVPQLGETAAWLAEMLPEVFQRIVQYDPQVLLRSDMLRLPATEAKQLCWMRY